MEQITVNNKTINLSEMTMKQFRIYDNTQSNELETYKQYESVLRSVAVDNGLHGSEWDNLQELFGENVNLYQELKAISSKYSYLDNMDTMDLLLRK